MDQPVLVAQTREQTGKGAARKLRRNDQLPAIFYGPESDATMLTVNYSDFEKIVQSGSGENTLFNLQIQSKDGTRARTAMLKEIQSDPVENAYLHVDFYEISMDKEVTVNVAIELKGTAIGVTNGGILENIRREVMVSCLPGKLTRTIEVDISNLDIGDTLHLKDIRLPEGMRTIEDAHLTVAVIAAPTVAAVEEVEEEELEKMAGESQEKDTEESEAD
jgi:large subunit ribosomal protein L25